VATRERVTFVITARDRTRSAFRRIRRSLFSLKSAAIGFVGALVSASAVARQFQFANTLESAARVLDVSITKLDKFRNVAKGVNIPFEQLFDILRQGTSLIGQAISGNEKLVRTFERLGVTFNDLQTLDIADIVAKAGEAGKRASNAGRAAFRRFQQDFKRVFGETGVNLTALFTKGQDSFVQQLEEATGRSAEQIQTLAEKQRQAQKQFAEIEALLAEALLLSIPLLLKAAETFADAARSDAFQNTVAAIAEAEGPTETVTAGLLGQGRAERSAAMDRILAGRTATGLFSNSPTGVVETRDKGTHAVMKRLADVLEREQTALTAP